MVEAVAREYLPRVGVDVEQSPVVAPRLRRQLVPDAAVVAAVRVHRAHSVDGAAYRRRLRKSRLDRPRSRQIIASGSDEARFVIIDVGDGDVDDQSPGPHRVSGVARDHQQPEVVHGLAIHSLAQNEPDLGGRRRSQIECVVAPGWRRDDTHGQVEERGRRVDVVALDRVLGAVHVLGGRNDEAGARLRRLGQLDGGRDDRKERRVVVNVQYLDAHLSTTQCAKLVLVHQAIVDQSRITSTAPWHDRLQDFC